MIQITPEDRLGIVPEGLVPLVLPQSLPGYDAFIVSWLIPGPPVVLVDPGPAASVPVLCRHLAAAGIQRLDAILLTHIHVDHAGGVGHLLNHFPDAIVVCHSRDHSHLVSPERLWEQTHRVLGPIAEAYGSPLPVPADRLVGVDAAKQWGATALATPGHAAGHTAYALGTGVMAGEAVGVRIAVDGRIVYRRPATPPRFFWDVALASLAVLEAENPKWLCYGHVGVSWQPRQDVATHRRQLQRWADVARDLFIAGENADDAASKMVQHLLVEDPDLIGFSQLPREEQRRERQFLRNSALGIFGAVNAASVPR